MNLIKAITYLFAGGAWCVAACVQSVWYYWIVAFACFVVCVIYADRFDKQINK